MLVVLTMAFLMSASMICLMKSASMVLNFFLKLLLVSSRKFDGVYFLGSWTRHEEYGNDGVTSHKPRHEAVFPGTEPCPQTQLTLEHHCHSSLDILL